ncbi:MAG: DUF3306 domain-containing protein [Rhodobacteraceae bacterium]|nr:DUF3306 domain-containing protein [Paracoccaceae bacterium]
MNKPQDFWSRRKAGVRAEAELEKREGDAAVLAEEHARLEEKTDDEILNELKLPDPDTLRAGDDFTAFMAKAVPERIRRRALRRLWLSNPALANLDDLLDYGDDFTDSATVIENLQTAYQVGKGMTRHLLEMAKRDAVAAEEESGPHAEAESGEVTLETPGDAADKTDTKTIVREASEPAPAEFLSPDEDDENRIVVTKRRLRFEFA